MKKSKIPITIITGFLGAGKTTFINFLLKQHPEIQFALVENEFGDVAIDTRLIKGMDASKMFELKQGCICCSINDEYELVLQELAERFPNVGHLLIETTGIADPSPVIQPFFKDKNLREIYTYNGTVCLVDALYFDTLAEKEISAKQLVNADHVLVNKAEKLSVAEKNRFEQALSEWAPYANIEFVSYGQTKAMLLANLQNSKKEIYFPGYRSAHRYFQSKTLTYSNPLPKTEFLRWLEYTLDIYKNKIYRTKGIVCFQNEPFEYILQGVGGNFELVEGDIILERLKSEIVFIGELEGLKLDFTSDPL